MKSKTWLILFFVSILLMLAAVAGLNALTDPFGVFGDPVYDWYSYDFTNNPRSAKITYLDAHHDRYDSFLVGASTTSSYPIDELNAYTGARFFNLFGYGADMRQTRLLAEYAIKNYHPKNLILNVSVVDGFNSEVSRDKLTEALPARVEGSSEWEYWTKYLLANPAYATAKIGAAGADTYLPQVFDVFDADTGAYDKSQRDVEPIGALAAYLEKYPSFQAQQAQSRTLWQIDACVEDVAAILRLCDEEQVNVTVFFAPFYADYLTSFKPEELAAFQRKLAGVTDFWDFSYSSASLDPRYFYDPGHFRNALGHMALARVYDREDIYLPEDFGVYVTEENVEEHVKRFSTTPADISHEADVPILTYHHLSEDGQDGSLVTPELFEAQMSALSGAGYTAVSLTEICDYVEQGTSLPEKPVVITFDDGYLSNYEYAWPILQRYNMKASIFVIGHSVGRDTYKDTGAPITPHFSMAQAREMADSGLIEIQSHSFDLHQSNELEPGTVYEDALPLEGEREADYIARFRADFQRSKQELMDGVGRPVLAYSYPHGLSSALSDALLREMGVKVTLTTRSGVNTVVRGLPQSLLGLSRISVTGKTMPEVLLAAMRGTDT